MLMPSLRENAAKLEVVIPGEPGYRVIGNEQTRALRFVHKADALLAAIDQEVQARIAEIDSELVTLGIKP